MSAATEVAAWSCNWGVRKFDEDATAHLAARLGRDPLAADFDAAKIDPYEVAEVERNLLTTAGLQRITNLIIGAAGQALTATSGRIGVGDATTPAAAVGDTNLAAATNRQFQPFDAGYPTAVGGVITVQSTFGGTVANFAWNEFGIDIGTPTVAAGTTVNAVLLNHRVGIAQGTKTSGQTWVAQSTITIA